MHINEAHPESALFRLQFRYIEDRCIHFVSGSHCLTMPAPSDILRFMRGQLFETPQLPNTTFDGQTIVITGANSGLGFECAKQV